MRLERLLDFDDIVIQCHDDPDADAIASGFALQRYLESHGKRTRLVYSGPRRIRKGNLVRMVKLFHIGIAHAEPSEWSENPPRLLVTVDCQDGESNVTPLPRGELAAIDHHAECGGPGGRDALREVRGDYGACSTILWSMLKDAGFELDRDLSSALYYGLYMDTVAFKSLAGSHSRDQEMRRELEGGELDRAGIEELKRANLNAETLRILGRAISELHFCHDYHFAVAQAQPCDPNILGVISDQVMEVEGVDLCVSYCLLPEQERKRDAEFKFSVRSYLAGITASDLAKYIANGLGGKAGGKNTSAAGGVLSERELKRVISSVAEFGWDGFSSAVGRLIYRKTADYCENSSALRKAYPELAQKLDDDAYVRRLSAQAEQGSAAAQNNLGVCCQEGRYVEQDEKEAAELFRRAAEQGLAEAQFNLALCCEYGRGVEEDWGQAAEWYRRAAEQGMAQAQNNLAVQYAKGKGVDMDPVQAVKWYRRAAEQGLDIAQCCLGSCYYDGSGVERQDLAQAAEWFRKAAEQGFAEAQLRLGQCFFAGEGIERDLRQAEYWFRQAAEQGQVEALYGIGLVCGAADNPEQDLEQAAEWFRRAAEQGLPEAQFNLGVYYCNGWAAARDPAEGVYWLRRAAEQGDPNARQALAQLFGEGADVPREPGTEQSERRR